MSRRRGLGSGLDALIPAKPETEAGVAIQLVAITMVRENRSQPRTQFDEQALDELAASIREHGVIQPLIVVADTEGGYELIAGERRLRAARRAGLPEVPVLVKQATPQQLLELALVENVQRADLNPLEEGLAYQTLKDDFGLTDEMIAQRVGKSRVTIVNARRLIRLIPEARQALLDGRMSAGHGRALLRIEQAADQAAALALVFQRDMSVRETERLAELLLHAGISDALRRSLLRGVLNPAQTQSLIRIEDPAQQSEALQSVLDHGLDVRQTEQLSALLVEGVPLARALDSLQNRTASRPKAPEVLGAPARPSRSETAQSEEDSAAQRMFEEILGTPVQLSRSNGSIRLSITVYTDEQLQALYDRLADG
ncbi:MAG: ParB/RepB/Spo0J family partition protein [Oscillochloris sp.]|nr:ParB/RepB/Spo0J family partition protein [Oscillochloris sp.]